MNPLPAAGRGVLEDAVQAIGRVTRRLSDVSGVSTAAVDTRYETVAALDSHGRTLLSRVLKAQSVIARVPATRVAPMVAAAREFFGILLNAYEGCLGVFESDSAAVGRQTRIQDCRLRLMRAGADRVIWELLAGGPAHPQLWNWLGAAFSAGESGDGKAALPGSAIVSGSSVSKEYLRAVAASTAALGLLPPRAALVLDRIMAFVLPMVNFRPEPFAGATCYVRPGEVEGPRRLVRPPKGLEGAWFFSPGVAARALREVIEHLDAGEVPAGLAAGEEGDALLRTVLEHFVRHWSAAPPVRRFRRHVIGGALSAVRGIDELQRLFAGRATVTEVEWSLRDVSRGGFGAYVSGQAEPGVRIGQLVGVKANGGAAWQLAIVRRTWVGAGAIPFVGLETLSQRPALARVDDGRASAEVFLCDPVLRGEALRIAVPRNRLGANVPLFVTSGGSVQKLKPLQGVVEGEGFELRVYQVL